MKAFEKRDNETGEQYEGRYKRYLTDKIIEDISKIALLKSHQIKSILDQLALEALEVVEEECVKLEKFEVSKIARDLIAEKQRDNK